MNETQQTDTYDVAVIGGGAAGLSGALMLGRSRRSVVVIDAGEPRNAPAAGVHGFLSREGMAPHELLRIGRDDVRAYGVSIVEASVQSVQRTEAGFTVSLDSGTTVDARRVLVTTGLVDQLPDVLGVRERWGRDVLHCPYCHGWEVRDQAIGILATSPFAAHQALMFRQLSSDVTVFLNDAFEPSVEQEQQFAARGIATVPGRVASVDAEADALTAVVLTDGTRIAVEALAVMPRVAVRAGFLAELGLVPTEHEMGIGDYIAVDATGATAVPGVFAAGNVTDPMAQVMGAAAAGAKTGAAVNGDLIMEETERATAEMAQSEGAHA